MKNETNESNHVLVGGITTQKETIPSDLETSSWTVPPQSNIS